MMRLLAACVAGAALLAGGCATRFAETRTPESHRLMLVRPMWADERSREAAIAKARAVVGRPYDFLGLVGLDVPDRFYSSGLAVEIYRPLIGERDLVPHPVVPGQLHYWGQVLFDSGPVPGARG